MLCLNDLLTIWGKMKNHLNIHVTVRCKILFRKPNEIKLIYLRNNILIKLYYKKGKQFGKIEQKMES